MANSRESSSERKDPGKGHSSSSSDSTSSSSSSSPSSSSSSLSSSSSSSRSPTSSLPPRVDSSAREHGHGPKRPQRVLYVDQYGRPIPPEFFDPYTTIDEMPDMPPPPPHMRFPFGGPPPFGPEDFLGRELLLPPHMMFGPPPSKMHGMPPHMHPQGVQVQGTAQAPQQQHQLRTHGAPMPSQGQGIPMHIPSMDPAAHFPPTAQAARGHASSGGIPTHMQGPQQNQQQQQQHQQRPQQQQNPKQHPQHPQQHQQPQQQQQQQYYQQQYQQPQQQQQQQPKQQQPHQPQYQQHQNHQQQHVQLQQATAGIRIPVTQQQSAHPYAQHAGQSRPSSDQRRPEMVIPVGGQVHGSPMAASHRMAAGMQTVTMTSQPTSQPIDDYEWQLQSLNIMDEVSCEKPM